MQVVWAEASLPIDREDWSGLSQVQQEYRLGTALEYDARRGFDYRSAPLMRLCLIRLAEDRYRLIWTHHHLLLDGWSTAILLEDIFSEYNARREGKQPDIRARRPYRDFIRQIVETSGEGVERYWRELLRGFTGRTGLGIERPNMAEPEPKRLNEAEQRLIISEETTRTLSIIAREQQLTINTVIQGIWAIILSRYSREEDVVFGATVSGRSMDLAGIDQMIGMFINTLPVRVPVRQNDRVAQWLRRLQEQQAEQRQYEHTGLARIQSLSDIPPGEALFENILVFENYPIDESLKRQSAGTGLRLSDVRGIESSGYPLTLIVVPGERLQVLIKYESARYEADAIQRLAGHIERLIAQITETPECRISDLSLVTEVERGQLLSTFNAPLAEFGGGLIHGLVARNALSRPDAAAVVCEEDRLTYKELERRANQIAGYLRSLGVGPESLVALCMRRSVEMVVAMLGVLKSGAAYVPLDLEYPKERLAFILEDTGAPVLLTQWALRDRLPQSPAKTVFIDAGWKEIAARDESEQAPAIHETNAAYVIYTSGSTGKPKGVVVSHREVVRLLKATWNWFRFDHRDVWTMFHSYAFDFSVWEVWGCLGTGGRLVAAPFMTSRTPELFYDLLVEQGVTVLNQTPSAFRQLIEEDERPGRDGALGLKYVIFGGEALDLSCLKGWVEKRGDEKPQLINMYGITETTVHVTYRRICAKDVVSAHESLIGRRIPDLKLYVLDAAGQPAPVGLGGELHVGGAGLARGYLNRPDLTSEQFIPNPFGWRPGERIYRSGDLARHLPDGDLEYLGRIDQQVKVRGYRIELGEIQAVLAEHPAVREAAVGTRSGSDGQRRIVAWVAVRAGQSLSAAELKDFARLRLPDYMLPSRIVLIGGIPLTTNGKVDWRALPDEIDSGLGQPFNKAATETQKILISIFAEVLELSSVGVTDDFFDLGGHSLLAIQVVNRVREWLNFDLPLKRLFASPTVCGIAEAIQQMRLENAGVQQGPVTRVDRGSELPLSFAQQRLWFLHKLDPDSPAYNVVLPLRIEGPLHFAALSNALLQMEQRHESLRTVFPSLDGKASQLAAPPGKLTFNYFDLGALKAPEREKEARRLVEAEACRPFNLEQGPVIRVALFRLERELHILMLAMHHIATDAWSSGILVDEMAELYASYASGKAPTLPEPPIQYADFACWQRKWLEGEVLENQLSYWRSQLADANSVLDLPADYSRPALRSPAGARLSFELPEELRLRLRALAREEHATLFMSLAAAFAVLLYRYTNQNGFTVATPVANRNRRELESVVGFFVNTLVLKCDLSGEPGFREALRRTKETALAAYAHQDLPFEKLVDELQPGRDLSRSPLTQVMFVLQNAPARLPKVEQLDITLFDVEERVAQFDVTFELTEIAGKLSGSIKYSTDLFEPETIRRMADHYANLISAMLDEPDKPVSLVGLLSDAQKTQLLEEWGRELVEYAKRDCVHERFERQARLQPDSPALVVEEAVVSYGELNRRANRLAGRLRELGVRPEVLVGVAIDRSAEMIVALVAILKAGGAYVPIDPYYPAERIALLLEDSMAPVLLTTSKLAQRLPKTEATLVLIDSDWEKFSPYPDCDLNAGVIPDNAAYVIYTSGSTGKPKGVVVSHYQISRLLQATEHWYGFNRDDVWTMFHSYAFDFSVWELWGALGYGGRLIVVSYIVSRSPDIFYELLAEHGVTVLNQTPSAFRQLIEAERINRSAGESSLRWVIFGGEALDSRSLNEWVAGHGETRPRLVNMYGITETTVHSTHRAITAADTILQSGSVIGSRIPDLRFYLLDRRSQLSAAGTPGELHIAGAGLARCYLNRPELTAERFVPNPYGVEPGDRLYRTGDLARIRNDGDLEYIGRIDEQVKIRGFRIEVGEIESIINRRPEVSASVVIARADERKQKRLIAYIVERAKGSLSLSGLREYLRQSLPDYMVPARLISIERLPLTPHGKIDRRALPDPDQQRPDLAAVHLEARTGAEELLAGIWAEILGLEEVGIHDNFFELGGDSILSIQVVARANRAGLRVTPRQIFQHQTIAELAAVAGYAPVFDSEEDAVSGPVPITPIQRWFFERRLQEPHHYNQAVLLEPAEPLDPSLVEKCWTAIVDHHDALRMRFVRAGRSWRQVNAEHEDSRIFGCIDFGDAPRDRHAGLLEEAAEALQSTLDLSEGPLIRVALFRLGPSEAGRMFVVVHHLVVDGVSWRILLEDFDTAYRAARVGKPISLGKKSSSFKRWAERLSLAASDRLFDSELDYWLYQTHGSDAESPGGSRGENLIQSEERLTVSLSPNETDALLKLLAGRSRVTVEEALIFAIARSFGAWTGDDCVRIDLESHGREEVFDGIDLSRTVGWFTSIYPIKIDLQPEGDEVEQVKAVKESLRRAPNRGIGYGALKYLGRREQSELLGGQAGLVLNYFGRLDRALPSDLLRPAHEKTGSMQSRLGRRAYLFEVNALVAAGELQVEWTFNRDLYRRDEIERLARESIDVLGRLIGRARLDSARFYAPIDFPLALLDGQRLDRLIAIHQRIEDVYPLSPTQQGLLFHSLYEPESGVYVTQLSCVLSGVLDHEKFERAWQNAVERHAVLRTAFDWRGGDPLQVVREAAKLSLIQEDWSDLDQAEQGRKLREFIDADRTRGFDFDLPPLMRMALIRLGSDRHRLVWSLHHIVMDGWSVAALIGEVFAAYEASLRRQASRPDARRPYKDYIAWVAGQETGAAESYWKELLSGFTSGAGLGLARGRDDGRAARNDSEIGLDLSDELTGEVSEFAKRRQLTLNTVVQGAWALLVHRYTGENDVLYGATVSGRSMALDGVDRMIGLFINTLPVRVRVAGRARLIDWLGGLQQLQVEQRHYEHISLGQIQSWSEKGRGAKLFDSIVVFENYPIETSLFDQTTRDGASLSVSDVVTVDPTNYDLTFAVVPGPRLSLRLGYDRRRFDDPAMERILRHVATILESMVEGARTVGEVSLLTGAERRQLLVEWNDTSAGYPSESCIHEVIEAHTRVAPDLPAVIFEGGTLSYLELNRRANRLARLLMKRGVGPGSRVAVSIERGPDLAVGLLGILKTGAAYAPLDPAQPRERLRYIAEETGTVLAVTQERLHELISGLGLRTVCLDSDSDEIASQPDKNLDTGLDPENAAYIVYTSGSTGKPKGIVARHRSVVNECVAFYRHHGLKAGERLLQFAALGFDVTAEEVFAPLMCGATVVMRSTSDGVGINDLLQWCEDDGITMLNLPAALWHEWVNQLSESPAAPPASLRLVVVGNEKALLERYLAWRRLMADRIEWKNAYGPTEATITTTIYQPHDMDVSWLQTAPIGRPISNSKVFLVDVELEPVPIGITGELYIGGEGLAHGYLNKPDQTAERFVPDSLSQRPGERLYRTGDLARYLEDGDIEFIGRVDDQVKIRGFRIEPGEIEEALLAHSSIREAAIVVHDDAEGRRSRLVAYIAARNSVAPSAAELRAFLNKSLPDYMTPAAFVVVESLPRLPNGKVDRRALSAHRPVYGDDNTTIVGPRTEIEAKLASIWQAVLGVERLGVTDNFFELGGDSILTIQVVARAGSAGLRLTPRQIFDHPTIAELAPRVLGSPSIDSDQGLVTGGVPLTPIQHWFFEQELDRPDHYNQAVVLEWKRAADPGILEGAFSALIEHHDALRMRFAKREDKWEQFNSACEGGRVFGIIDLSVVARDSRDLLFDAAAEMLQASLNLAEGPLLRTALFITGDGKPGLLLIVAHHLVMDGVSWRILLEDLDAACGRARLPAKTSSFKRWSEGLYEHAQTAEARGEIDYWLGSRRGEPACLPFDHVIGENDLTSWRSVKITLNETETRALLVELPRLHKLRTDEILLAALARTLCAWTGRQRLSIDLEGHGREDIIDMVDVSRTIGWFTSMYPVGIDLTDPGDTAGSLREVKEQLRRIPNRGIGYGLLRYLGDGEIGTRLAAQPDAQVAFNYLGQFDQSNRNAVHFSLSDREAGAAQDPRGRRSHLMELNGLVFGSALHIDWGYSESFFERETVERLARRLEDFLAETIAYCGYPGASCLIPADFPLAAIEADVLNRLAERGAIDDIYPLAPMQQGMLFHTLYEPDSGAYVTRMSCELTGDLDLAAFEWSWREVCKLHPILRTRILWEGVAEPVQIVSSHVEFSVDFEEWIGLTREECSRRLTARLEQERAVGFDLSKAPLMRVALIRVDARVHHMIWSHHHLLMDGWSVPALLSEICACYQAKREGRAPLLEKRRPYRDYIEWIRRRDKSEAASYWRQLLSGFTRPTAVEIWGSPGVETGFSELDVELPRDATGSLTRYAASHGLTLNTIVQGAWSVLLGRYSGEDDVVFGATVSGRTASIDGLEKMIGLFINTLPVRVAIDGSARTDEWLKRIQTQQIESQQYEYTALGEIQRCSDIGAGAPLFHSIVVFENYPIDRQLKEQFEAGWDLEVASVRAFEETNYPLTLSVDPGESLTLAIGYDRERYDDLGITRLLEHLRVVLGAIAGGTPTVGEIDLLDPVERRQLLEEWSSASHDFLIDRCVHELFEDQVERTPDAPAVISGSCRLTFRELDERSNRVARYLRRLGAGPDVSVAVCLERSPEMIVAIVGILKSGAAYAPIDPVYPQERLFLVLSDTRPAAVVTRAGVAGRIPEGKWKLVCLDLDWDVISEESCGRPARVCTPANLAYVIYTSGSTGTPKGAMIEHRALSSYIVDGAKRYSISTRDRILQFASLTFDTSAEEIFLGLFTGASLVLRQDSMIDAPDAFIRKSRDDGLTVIDLPTAYWHELAASGREDEWAKANMLRLVVIGGERALASRLLAWRATAGDRIRLVNSYGPCEATIAATEWDAREGSGEFGSFAEVPIGRPVGGARVYVLDRKMRLAPKGVAGELYIGGCGLSRGYQGLPHLTAETFKPDPFADAPGSRLYATGDLVRFRFDGNLEFVGRLDHQVKIRGMRIEPGEIESTLNSHPAVAESVVVAREDQLGDRRLAAYVVFKPSSKASLEDLRTHVAERLPVHMVPAVFVPLEATPLTSHGKIDRTSLPLPRISRDDSLPAALPRTEVETILARIWQEALGAEHVGIHDNFFSLGGDSIVSLQVVARANQAGLRLTPRQVFEHPTIAQLSSVANLVDAVETEQELVTGYAPLTPVQEWFFEQDLPNPNHYNQSLMLEIDHAVSNGALEHAFHRVVEHHDALRMRFEFESGRWKQYNADLAPKNSFSWIDLAEVTDKALSAAIESAAEQAAASLELNAGPVIRAVAFQPGHELSARLLIVAHHLVIDVVSWGILLEDMEAALFEGRHDGPASLPAKTTSFKQWALRLSRYARSNEARQELEYWREQALHTAGLPVDGTAGPNDERSTVAVMVALEEEQTRAALHDTPQVYGTQINELLLAALLQAVSGWTGEPRVLVDLEGHGREHIIERVDLTRTVGWFTTIFPVALRLPENGGPGDLIKSVKEQLRAIPAHGIGYGILKYLADEETRRELGAGNRAEISFNYLGQTDQIIHNGLFRVASEAAGAAVDPAAPRKYLIDINAAVVRGRLEVEWTYSRNRYEAATIQKLADRHIAALRELIVHCQSAESGGYTPSDFPFAELGQEELDRLIAEIGEITD
jgi:amino acid adenylation domain-containing protein/non-ribosomal peptide synthase protein (TIGR01720 family)